MAAHPDTETDRHGSLTEQELARLGPVPRGAAALAGIAVLLLLLAWVLIYAAVYLPRGMVG
jgi:hypothetical protein